MQGGGAATAKAVIGQIYVLLMMWRPGSPVFIQEFSEEPFDQMKLVGSDVVLPCKVKSHLGAVQWTKDGFALGTSRELSDYKRYSMRGSGDHNDYSLRIEQIVLEDDAEFQCQIGQFENAPGVRSRNAKLSVLIPPSMPEIIQGSYVQSTAGEVVSLDCIAREAKPAAKLTWRDHRGNILESHSETEALPDKKRFNTKASLKFVPKREHHNHALSCQAVNSASSTLPLARIVIFVRYPPEVSLQGLKKKTKEGDTVRLRCVAEANPSDVSFTWYKNGELIQSDGRTDLVIPNIHRDMNSVAISCEVSNSVGKSRATVVLDVRYAPRFVPHPTTFVAEVGSDVTLKCEVDANPKPDIMWIFGHTNTIVGTGPYLTIANVKAENEGHYICKVLSEEFQQINSEISILLKGPPRIIANEVQFGYLGKEIRIICPMIAIPVPEEVIWFRGPERIDIRDERFRLAEEETDNQFKSTLFLQKATDDDFGVYNCSAYNRYGGTSFRIILKKSESASLLLVISATSGAICFVIVLIISFLVYQRKQHGIKVVQEPVNNSTKPSNVSSPMELDRLTNDTEMKEFRPTFCGSLKPARGADAPNESTLQLIPSSGDYHASSECAQKNEYYNNNGYISFADYSKDYLPPSLYGSRASVYLNAVDPRYSATYGNPFLRNRNTVLPSLALKGGLTVIPSSHTIGSDPSLLATHV